MRQLYNILTIHKDDGPEATTGNTISNMLITWVKEGRSDQYTFEIDE